MQTQAPAGGQTQGYGAGQVSPDGRFVWNGAEWRPVLGWGRTPTDWTGPMHISVMVFFLAVGLFYIAQPFLFGDQFRAVLRNSVGQNPRNSNLSPDQVEQSIEIAMVLVIVVFVALALFYFAAALLSMLDWAWTFYLALVLLGLSAISILQSIVGLATPNATTNPPEVNLVNLLVSALGLALFFWLLVARVQRGVWACRRLPVAG